MYRLRFVIGALLAFATSLSAQNGDGGIASFHAHRYADARRELDAAVRAHPDDARIHHYLGRIAIHETRFQDAIHHLQRAVELEPSVAEHQVLLGRAYGQLAVRSGLTKKFGLAKRARAALERAVELDPASIEARSGLIQFHLLAPGLVGGSSSKARAHAAEIAKQNPFRGALARAWIAEDRNDYDQAAREYRDAISRAPDSLIAYWGLAQLWQRGQRFDSSFALMDGVIQRNPSAMPAYYYYGRAASLSGQHLPEAVAALERYISHEPQEGEPPRSSAHYRLGLVYERMGERDKAKREFETSLRLEPTRGEVKAALRRVR
ncbi:MAG TPA: tetratricopeptide repeat protein [Gemmatimonadaceae bacterium]|nr:tetratricopeptide repeat protein [Gemmatimonadaceae bacterium]